MLGQTSQNANAPQERPPTLRERVAEQRTAGPYTYRYATPLGYAFTMFIMRNWRVVKPITILSDTEKQGIPSSVTVPARLGETAHLKPADDWIKESVKQGYAVITIAKDPPPGDELPETIVVRTRRAAVAQELTKEDETALVLNEPTDGWTDVLKPASLLAFPMFFAVGLVAVLVATEAVA